MSQAPPAVFSRIQPYLEFIDISIQASRFTLHQCTEMFDVRYQHLIPKTIDLILFRVLWADFEATSKVVSLVNKESWGDMTCDKTLCL